MIKAVILASGKSKRFGGTKLLEEFHGKPLIEICLNAFSKAGIEGTVVTAHPEISEISHNMGFKTVPGGKFLSESIKSGLKAIDYTTGVIIHLADIPFVKPETIKNLVETFSENSDRILIPYYRNRPGHPRIFPRSVINEFFEITGDTGGREIVKRHAQRIIRMECGDLGTVYDIDTREHLKNAYTFFRI